MIPKMKHMFTLIAALQSMLPFCVVQAVNPILIAHRGLLTPFITLHSSSKCFLKYLPTKANSQQIEGR